jgi:hypothetical protein
VFSVCLFGEKTVSRERGKTVRNSALDDEAGFWNTVFFFQGQGILTKHKYKKK